MRQPRCTGCGTALAAKDIVAAGPFPCPVCQTQLQASGSYTQLIGWGSAFVSIIVLAALGFRGFRLLCAVLIAFVPVLYVATNFAKYLFPPRIEIYLPEDAALKLRNGPR
jgi:hypothetical protein